MLTLGIDTSGKTASCALCTEDAVLGQNFFVTSRTHSQVILPMVKKLLSETGRSLSDIDAFAAAKGPGSYAGLRIGISAVKGICFGLDKPCRGVSTLEAIAYNFKGTDSLVCAVMHARQELVYRAFFETRAEGGVHRLEKDGIIPLTALTEEFTRYGDRHIICAGDYSRETAAASKRENITPAAPQLNVPLAAGICFAAMDKGFHSPEELNAEYMQLTKAEKDLLEKNPPPQAESIGEK